MSDELDRIEGAEDNEPPERRRNFSLLLLMALFLICVTAGVGGAFASGLLGPDEPTTEPSTAEPPTTEPLTEEPQATTPSTATDTPTFTPSFTPTDTPTPTLSPTPTKTRTPTPDRPVCTCGDGVCCPDEAASCPADCGGGECTGPCCDNGGLQWQGEVCVCPGLVDIVTVCMDGSKSDQITDQSCQPTQNCAPPPPQPVCTPGGYVCTCITFYTATCVDSCTGASYTNTSAWWCP